MWITSRGDHVFLCSRYHHVVITCLSEEKSIEVTRGQSTMLISMNEVKVQRWCSEFLSDFMVICFMISCTSDVCRYKAWTWYTRNHKCKPLSASSTFSFSLLCLRKIPHQNFHKGFHKISMTDNAVRRWRNAAVLLISVVLYYQKGRCDCWRSRYVLVSG